MLPNSLSLLKLRKEDRTGYESDKKDFSAVENLISFIKCFVDSTTEKFFDDSSFFEITKLENSFNLLKIEQVSWVRSVGFFSALKFYERNEIFADRVFSLLSFFSPTSSPFHQDVIKPHVIFSAGEIISSLSFSFDAKTAALKFVGLIASNNVEEFQLIQRNAIIESMFNALENFPPQEMLFPLLKSINCTTKFEKQHVLCSLNIGEMDRFMNIRELVCNDDENVKIEAIKLLCAIFDGCGCWRCRIPVEELQNLVTQILELCIEASGELQNVSLDLIQRYSSLSYYANVLVDCDVFNAIHDSISKDGTVYKCLYIISNTMSWNDMYINKAIESGAYSFAVDILMDGNYVDSRPACYIITQIFNKGTVEQIEDSINDDIFDRLLSFIENGDDNLTIAILCSLKRALFLEESEGKENLKTHLIQGSYLDGIEELTRNSNDLISSNAISIISKFEKL